MKITIDTCCINANSGIEEMNKIEALSKAGIVKIIGTERLIKETENHKIRNTKAINYQNVSEPFTVGKSRIGSFYISSENGFDFKELARILFPDQNPIDLNENDSNDVMHLLAHAHSNSEYFVTLNVKDFIHGKKTNKNRGGSYKNEKQNALDKLGIKVVTPTEILQILKIRNAKV